MTDYRDDLFDVLVTAPVSNQNVKIEGYPFKGHKEYIETCLGEGAKGPCASSRRRPPHRICNRKDTFAQGRAGAITQESSSSRRRSRCTASLKRDFLITNPRIAVLALNPSNNGRRVADQRKPASSSQPSTSLPSRKYKLLVLTLLTSSSATATS